MLLRSGRKAVRSTGSELGHRQDPDPTMGGDAPQTADPPPASRFAIKRVIFPEAKSNLPPKDTKATPNQTTPPPIIVPYIKEDDSSASRHIAQKPAPEKPARLDKASPSPTNISKNTNATKKPAEQPNYPNNASMIGALKALLHKELKRDEYVTINKKFTLHILANDETTHSKICKLLKEAEFNYYSYPTMRTTAILRRFVLYDLNDYNTSEEIAEDLQKYGLTPVDIKSMTIKTPRYPNQANFIVYFDAQDKITLPMIQKAAYICSAKVRWDHYKSNSDRKIQCKTCWRYNHQADTCGMTQVCYLCSDYHAVEDCPLRTMKLEMGLRSIPDKHLKCVNCSGNHSAINKDCPARLAHQSKLHNHSKQPKTASRVNFVDAPTPTPENTAWKNSAVPDWIAATRRKNRNMDSPAAPPTRRSNTTTHRPNNADVATIMRTPMSSRDHPPTPRQTNLSSHQSNQTYTPKMTRPNNNNCDINNSNNNIFSPQELMDIFQEMVTKMGQCRSKEEQLTVMMRLALKYVPCRD